LSPRVIQGSLFTTVRGEEANVNLKITTQNGICVIGPDAECLVKESTRKPGQIYDVVEVDGMSLKIRYSGADVRLEKFSILPEASDEESCDLPFGHPVKSFPCSVRRKDDSDESRTQMLHSAQLQHSLLKGDTSHGASRYNHASQCERVFFVGHG